MAQAKEDSVTFSDNDDDLHCVMSESFLTSKKGWSLIQITTGTPTPNCYNAIKTTLGVLKLEIYSLNLINNFIFDD